LFGGGPIGSDGSTRNLIDPSHRKFHYRYIQKQQAGSGLLGRALRSRRAIHPSGCYSDNFGGIGAARDVAHVRLTPWVKTDRRS
jgi:hypothetical protein